MEPLARTKISACYGCFDSWVHCRCVESQKASLATTVNADGRVVFLPRKPIYGRQSLLHLVANDVSPHLKCHAIDELPVRLIRQPLDTLAAGIGVLAIDQHWH